MAEVRCPMCSKLNPADQEICQYCQARLIPLQGQAPPDGETIQPPGTPTPAGQDDSTPGPMEWWQSLHDDSAEQQPSTANDREDDWIRDLRERPLFDASLEHGESDWFADFSKLGGAEAETSDWLSRIRGETARSRYADADAMEPEHMGSDEVSEWLTQGDEAEAPEWLTGVEMPGETLDAPDDSSGQAFLEEPTDLPDWLLPADEPASLDESAFAQAVPEQDEGLPDWLTDVQKETSAPVPAEEKTGLTGMLAWLKDQPEKQPGADEPERPEVEEATEWSHEASPVDETERSGQGGLPDWLLDRETEAETPSLGQEMEGVDLPDWLKEETALAAAPSAEEAELEEEAIPDRLLRETQEAEEPIAEAAEPGAVIETPAGEPPISPDGEEVPDWMASSAEELPDWLVGEEAEIQAASAAGAGMPDWFDLEQQETDLAVEPSEIPVEDDVHDIMASLSRQTAAPGPDYAHPEDQQIEEDMSWLSDLESTYPDIGSDEAEAGALPEGVGLPFVTAESKADSEFVEDLPAWLSSAVIEEGASETAERKATEDLTQEELETGLMPAELPSWLEAMRPVESVAAAVALVEEDAEEEGAGPLAGLRGVLKAEPDISYTRKTPAYSVKLQASENQLANAELLRKLIETEGEARPIPSTPVITSQYILRIAIFLLLGFSILVPLILGVPQFALPTTPATTADALVVSQLISGVPPGAPVLIAVDYEPGLAGEMDLYMGAVLEHLMAQGAFLTLVSSSPSGPLQAERLLMGVNRAGNYQYIAPNNYLNLGFVPGGPPGLLSFAAAPQRTLPLALDGMLAWQGTAIAGFQDLSQFALVVVATENPDTARAWIEQVQPRIGTTPMLLVASAQAEPIVRPYYEGLPQQVQGLLSGPAMSGTYANLVPSIGQKRAQVYWTPFSIGVLIGSALILVGGSMNAIMVLLKRRNEKEEAEQ